MRRIAPTPTHATLWLGLVALVVGVVLLLTAPPSSFGWFHWPLSSAPTGYAFVAGVRPWQTVAGPVLVLLGAVVAAFALGRLTARARRR